MKKLLIICGPSATGKTALGIALSKKFHGEIINADSRQVYRGMDIITGKDLQGRVKFINSNKKLQIKKEKYSVGYRIKEDTPVWLIDIVDPNYNFNVGEYTKLAQKVIQDIQSRNRLPIVVGGTGLYIKALVEPLFYITIAPNKSLRSRLNKKNRKELAEYLQQVDYKRWVKMNQSDRLNPRRLIRAIEIADYQKKHSDRQSRKFYKQYDYLMVGLKAKRETIYRRIDIRVEARIKQGAEKEIRELLRRGFGFNNSVLGKTIGYKEWELYFIDKISKEEVIQKWKYSEHDYVRRQLTWFKKQKKIEWFDIEDKKIYEKIEKLVGKWYTQCK